MESALVLVPKFSDVFKQLGADGLPGIAKAEGAVKKLLKATTDPLGARWAAIKAIDGAEAGLKAQADDISRMRGHLDAMKSKLRKEAQLLVGNEPDQKVQRPEFSAGIVATQVLEAPKKVEEWPTAFQKRVEKIEPDKAQAIARLKAGEEFEGLKLVEIKTIRFT